MIYDQDNFNKEEIVGLRKKDSLIMEVRQVKQDLTSLKDEVLGLLKSIIHTINRLQET